MTAPDARPGPGIRDVVLVACCAAWLLPPVMAATRAVRAGWYPVGDQALIAIRARDVLTEHHPLVGTAASAALGSGYLTNHPGPLLFDLAAAPVRALGSGTGLVGAMAAINFAAGLLAVLAAARQGGRTAAVATTVGLGVLVWSAGNQALIDPYNPTAAMVPFFAVLVLAWAAVNGDRWALPWLVLAASFCVQTNLAYVITTVPIVAIALAAFVWSARGRDPWRAIARRALPVGAVVWAQPLLEQLLHGRDGNLARLVRATGEVEPPLGLADGTKRTAAVISMPSSWGRGGFDSYGFLGPTPSTAAAVGSLLVVLALFAGLAVVFHRRLHDPVTARLLAGTAAVVVIGWIGAVRVPLSPLLGFRADYIRWLWPIAAMCVTAAGVAAGRLLLRYGGPAARPRPVLTMAVGALAVAAVAAAPAGPLVEGARETDQARRTAVALNRVGVEVLPAGGVEFESHPPDYPVFGYALLAALQERGVPFFTRDGIGIRQFGERRRAPEDPPPPVFAVVIGLEAVAAWDDALGCVAALDDGGRARLVEARDELARALARPGYTLSETGQRFARSMLAPTWMAGVPAGRPTDAGTIVDSTQFVTLLAAGLLAPPAEASDAAREFVALRDGLEDTTACIVVDPRRPGG